MHRCGFSHCPPIAFLHVVRRTISFSPFGGNRRKSPDLFRANVGYLSFILFYLASIISLYSFHFESLLVRVMGSVAESVQNGGSTSQPNFERMPNIIKNPQRTLKALIVGCGLG